MIESTVAADVAIHPATVARPSRTARQAACASAVPPPVLISTFASLSAQSWLRHTFQPGTQPVKPHHQPLHLPRTRHFAASQASLKLTVVVTSPVAPLISGAPDGETKA